MNNAQATQAIAEKVTQDFTNRPESELKELVNKVITRYHTGANDYEKNVAVGVSIAAVNLWKAKHADDSAEQIVKTWTEAENSEGVFVDPWASIVLDSIIGIVKAKGGDLFEGLDLTKATDEEFTANGAEVIRKFW